MNVINYDGEQKVLRIRFNGDVNTWNGSEEMQWLLDHYGDEADEVHFYVTTMGGTAVEGIGIYSALKNSEKLIKVFPEGYVASAGVMFCCGANEVVASSVDIFKVHFPGWSGVEGSDEDIEKLIKDHKPVSESYVKALMEKTGRSEDEVVSLMNEDRWMTAEEAKDFGIVDVVKEGGNISASVSKLEQLKSKSTDRIFKLAAQAEEFIETGASTDMTIEELKAEIDRLKTNNQASDDKAEALQAKVDELQAKVDAAESQDEVDVDEIKREAAEKAVDDYKEQQAQVKTISDLCASAKLDAKGDTATEIQLNALKQLKAKDEGYLKKLDAYSDVQITVAFDALVSDAANRQTSQSKTENLNSSGGSYVGQQDDQSIGRRKLSDLMDDQQDK